jgi:hypothetical protein
MSNHAPLRGAIEHLQLLARVNKSPFDKPTTDLVISVLQAVLSGRKPALKKRGRLAKPEIGLALAWKIDAALQQGTKWEDMSSAVNHFASTRTLQRIHQQYEVQLIGLRMSSELQSGADRRQAARVRLARRTQSSLLRDNK